MARRRRFWAEHPVEATRVPCPEARGLMTERIIFSPQDAISLSIEYTSDELAAWQRSEPDPEVPLRRYLQCPAMLRVEHLKKFICNKYTVDSQLYHVDILYKRVPLPDHYTLMDIAYIYSWKRNEPMKFFFRITDLALVSERFDYFEPSSKQVVAIARYQQQPRATKQQIIVNNNNNIEKKSTSPARQHAENNDTSSDVIKTCDSDSKQTKEKCELSDKTPSSDKKYEKDVINTSFEDKCKSKINNEKNKEQKEIVNNNQKEISETSDNNKCDKQISENSETNKVKQEKIVIKIKSEVKTEIDENVDNNSDIKTSIKLDSNNIGSVKPSSDISSKTNSSKVEVQNNDSKVPINNKSVKSEEKQEISPQAPVENIPKSTEPKVETIETSSILNESAEDSEKNQFLMSIQLTAKNSSPPTKNSSPPALKPIFPDLIRSKVPAQKRKYNRKNEKSPNSAKKPKLDNKPNEPVKKLTKITETLTKMRKIAPKSSIEKLVENDTLLKIKIKNPIVRHMVTNLKKQASNLTKIVEQTDSSKFSNANIITEQNQNEQLQSLIDSCKLNIPSSLSITLTESPRNEDGTIVQSKPAAIKPVQNYIEILKLPDKNISGNESLTETPKKSDALKTDNAQNGTNSSQNRNTSQTNCNNKHTFQTMFEETIKRDESMKAQLFQIQNQAKSLEIAKKAAASSTKLNVPKAAVKKQQSNALDLSTTSPKSESSSPNSNNSHNANIPNMSTPNTNALQNISKVPQVPRGNGHNALSPNSTSHNHTNGSSSNKRNILEIAHQLSKRSRIESETLKIPNMVSPTPKISPKPHEISSKPKVSEANTPSPPQQIIVNSNFSSGGSILIKRSPKKVAVPRLPVAKVPTPKLNPPNIRNGGLLKFSNYTAKLATNSANNISAKSPPIKNTAPTTIAAPSVSPSSTKSDSPNNTIHGLTPNQLLEKYNITNLAQFNANLNQAQLAFQQALMVSHQLELHRMQQNSQKHWMTNPNILAHYENYVQSLKNQQNQMIGNSSKN